jgi:hypothetical protein
MWEAQFHRRLGVAGRRRTPVHYEPFVETVRTMTCWTLSELP